MNTIHAKWLRPMPAYWQDFADRDAPQLDPDWQSPRVSVTPRACVECGDVFTPASPQASNRKTCYEQACVIGRRRKTRNRAAKKVLA